MDWPLLKASSVRNAIWAPRIGVAGWSIPSGNASTFGSIGSHLERYAQQFNAAEINSSFHRPHRASTYARWAESVGSDFRFAVKVPKTVTHVHRLQNCHDLIALFAEQVAGLSNKRGPVLVQLPPSLAFDEAIAVSFFEMLRVAMPGAIVCEPRHASWFELAASAVLARHRIARVAADPGCPTVALDPGGWLGLAYFRLHGAPHVYRSAYSSLSIERHAARLVALATSGTPTWTIYDNTAGGMAVGNALDLLAQAEGRI